MIADADLPSGVEVATLTIDDDDDAATDEVEVDNGYSLTVSIPDRDVPVTLINLGDMVNDDDGDDLDITVTSGGSHLVHDPATDNLLLTYLPPEADPGPRVDMIKVTVSDGYNGADDADQVLYIEISVTEEPPEPVRSEFTSVIVEEGSDVCVIMGETHCSLAGIIENGISFQTESGVDVGP